MAPPRTPMETSSRRVPPKPIPTPPICFSFAACSKTLIDHLRSLSVPILPGLTDREISAVESSLGFSFPPDLRSILHVGLPAGPHFPDWRTDSVHNLQILFNLPTLNLSKNIARNGFWVGSWGARPENDDVAIEFVRKLLEHAPILVPVYGNCYVPSTSPNLAGNPVFCVDGDGVRVVSFDVAGFFRRFGSFLTVGFDAVRVDGGCECGFVSTEKAPPWIATEARRIQFWTEAAESGRGFPARVHTRSWWLSVDDDGLRASLDAAFRKLREGGWEEAEIREMMMMMDDCDGIYNGSRLYPTEEGDHMAKYEEEAKKHVRILSGVLLRAGWSREDVAYSLDLDRDHEVNGGDGQRHTSCCLMEGEDRRNRSGTTTLMHLLSLEA